MDEQLFQRIARGTTGAADAADLREQLIGLAKRISDAATCLDWLKRIHPPKERAEAERHVEDLHDIAQLFAADRAGEIYAPEESLTLCCKEA